MLEVNMFTSLIEVGFDTRESFAVALAEQFAEEGRFEFGAFRARWQRADDLRRHVQVDGLARAFERATSAKGFSAQVRRVYEAARAS